jgi:Fis family transcriptional regulator, factor for inversion stimulation protein
MNVGEAMLEKDPELNTQESGEVVQHPGSNQSSLRESVRTAVRTYLDQLDGQLGTEVYQMVLSEIEAPLLEEILIYTRNNQSKASRMLGLNRGTLRKKLKQHGLLTESNE